MQKNCGKLSKKVLKIIFQAHDRHCHLVYAPPTSHAESCLHMTLMFILKNSSSWRQVMSHNKVRDQWENAENEENSYEQEFMRFWERQRDYETISMEFSACAIESWEFFDRETICVVRRKREIILIVVNSCTQQLADLLRRDNSLIVVERGKFFCAQLSIWKNDK